MARHRQIFSYVISHVLMCFGKLCIMTAHSQSERALLASQGLRLGVAYIRSALLPSLTKPVAIIRTKVRSFTEAGGVPPGKFDLARYSSLR
jgi:hypothetical protein